MNSKPTRLVSLPNEIPCLVHVVKVTYHLSRRSIDSQAKGFAAVHSYIAFVIPIGDATGPPRDSFDIYRLCFVEGLALCMPAARAQIFHR